MRTALLLTALLLPLAGCLSDTNTGEDSTFGTLPRYQEPLTLLDLPEIEGATITDVEGGYDLVLNTNAWSGPVTIPGPATYVAIRVEGGEGGFSAGMSHSETGRRRCNTQPLTSFSANDLVGQRCSGLTAIDLPGESWNLRAAGPSGSKITIEFRDTPVDGLAGTLDLAQISHMEYEIEETQFLRVPSFDGTMLWVEVTKPVGEGPFPAIISSSPYNDDGSRTSPAMWAYWTQDWARRGYVAVNADVRGFGESDGCVEVWGYNEQLDQVFLVDWIADQPWSDGHVGFYGQSYLGTTAMEAAVYAPEALDAIIAIAPVATAYHDWHYGGVPNLEAVASPGAAYQVGGTATVLRPEDPIGTALRTLGGVCDATLSVRSNDPRAVYDQFYIERDFAARAGNIEAAVLYTQGFEDRNVKGAMIPYWFNDIQSEKLGLFGHWLHQHPPRADEEVLFMAWMDQFVKGKDLGLDGISQARVVPEPGVELVTDSWPVREQETLNLWIDGSNLQPESSSNGGTLLMDPTGLLPLDQTMVTATFALEEDLALDGWAKLYLDEGMLVGVPNAYLFAELWEEREDGSRDLLTWGEFNLAHRFGYDKFEAVLPTDNAFASLPFMPTSHIVPSSSTLQLELRAANTLDNTYPLVQVASWTLGSVELELPVLPLEAYADAGLTGSN